MGTGELAALTTAALWALASLFYGRTKLSAWQINFGKNLIASVILFVHLAVASFLAGRTMFSADGNTWGLLAVSSLTGIVVGDTFYFRSLQILGPRRALMVSMTSPLFATVAGWIVLGETLTFVSLAGIALTMGGIAVVISERADSTEIPGHFPGTTAFGVIMGVLAALCNAIGGTFSRLGTQGNEWLSASGCDPLEATVIRVWVAAAFSVSAAILTRSVLKTARESFRPAGLKMYFPAVICGTWLGIWMSQIAYKHTYLAIALTLTCTTPLFVMPMLRMTSGYRMTVRGIFGAVISIAGVYLAVTG